MKNYLDLSQIIIPNLHSQQILNNNSKNLHYSFPIKLSTILLKLNLNYQMINYDARAQKLKSMLTITQKALQGRQHSEQFQMPIINQIQLPSESVLIDLVRLSSDLKTQIQGVYSVSQPTLKQIKALKTKKENIQKLVDMVTSIMEIKRLSYGLGKTNTQLYNNIKTFVQLRDKVLFCDKHIAIVEQELEKLKTEYRTLFDKAIKQSNSENLEEYSKILNLIPDKTETNSRSLQGLVDVYCQQMKKDLAAIQKDLFQIPLEVNSIDDKYDYKFFELVNNTLKIFVNKLKIYQQNTKKLYGESNILKLVVGLIETILNPLLSQIFKRQIRYFSVGKHQKSIKDPKDIQKLKHFVSQYGSIANQIQRFIFYLYENSLKQSEDSTSRNKLEQTVNFSSLIQMNTTLIQNSKQLIKLQIDYLYTESPFVSMILHFNKELKKSLEKQNLQDIKSVQQFLDQLSLIFKRGITRGCKTINPMIALSMIDFQSNLLMEGSSLVVFNELVDKHLNKATIGSVSQLALIITLNCLSAFPQSLKKQLESVKIPEQLNKEQIQTQLNELKSSNNLKVKQEIKKYCLQIVSLPHFSNLLQSDYKQLISGWNKLHKIALQIFIQSCCQLHALKLLQSLKKKKIQSISLLAFQKQVRSIVNEYENLSQSVNVFDKFRIVLTLISILPIQNSEQIKKFTKDLKQKERDQINEVLLFRKKTVQ